MTKGHVTRVVLADRHRILREGLRALLEAESGLQVVGQAGDGAEAMKLATELTPDIFLLDSTLWPGVDPDSVRDLANSARPVRTIVLASDIETCGILEVFELGVRGLVLKESSMKELIQSIHSVMAGEYWLLRESRPSP